MFDWDAYFLESRTREPHPVFEKFLSLLANVFPEGGNENLAYDLGCGNCRNAIELSRLGWSVTAVDNNPTALAESRSFLNDVRGVNLIESDISELNFEPCLCILAQFSLFFLPAESMFRTLESIKNSLLPGGVFCGQFIGPQDTWANECSTISKEQLEDFLVGFKVIHHEHILRPGKTLTGQAKDWDLHHLILQREKS